MAQYNRQLIHQHIIDHNRSRNDEFPTSNLVAILNNIPTNIERLEQFNLLQGFFQDKSYFLHFSGIFQDFMVTPVFLNFYKNVFTYKEKVFDEKHPLIFEDTFAKQIYDLKSEYVRIYHLDLEFINWIFKEPTAQPKTAWFSEIIDLFDQNKVSYLFYPIDYIKDQLKSFTFYIKNKDFSTNEFYKSFFFCLHIVPSILSQFRFKDMSREEDKIYKETLVEMNCNTIYDLANDYRVDSLKNIFKFKRVNAIDDYFDMLHNIKENI